MASSGPDRSIAGISLPQWMKSKISDRYDLEQNAFSPPTDDDGFFLYRYPPKARSVEPEESTASVITVQKKLTPIHLLGDSQPEVFVQHTPPCRQVITSQVSQPNIPLFIAPKESGGSSGRAFDASLGRVKSMGTDDGFKGEGAACGYSVVAVAQQMLSEKTGALACPKYERLRRNSKSLPASPQSSPKLLRKNPYFTNILFGSVESVDGGDSSVKRVISSTTSGSLLSAAIESQKSSAEDLLAIPAATPPTISIEAAVSSTSSGATRASRTFRAKPSELREMNFWSPTSM